MLKYLQLQMISMLQSMQCDDSLQRGSITIIAKRFDMAYSTVYQLWEQAVCMHATGYIISHPNSNVLLTSGYQPSLMKFLEDVAYFTKLNLPFLPQIMNEKSSDICFVVVVRILSYMCKYITCLLYPLHRIDTSSSINISNQEMCYNDNDNDLSMLYCCLYCCLY